MHQPLGPDAATSSASAWGNRRSTTCWSRSRRPQGRTVEPDAEPEKGYYYRSDHFEFAKQGVPALDPEGGRDYIGKPAGYGKQKHDEYTEKDYHKVSDEVKPDWDLSGAVEDLPCSSSASAIRVANAPGMPQWKPGAEFKAKRDSMLAAATR